MSINEQSVHCRHVLNLLGVNLWAQTTTATQSLPVMSFDRFNQSSVHKNLPQPILSAKSQTKIQTKIQAKPEKLAQFNQTADRPQDLTQMLLLTDAKSADSSTNQETASPQTTTNPIALQDMSIGYEMEGVRAGDWVLVADVSSSSRDELSVWVSLKSALSRWATAHDKPFETHHISYPVSDELPSTPSLAQRCFDGFVLRLQIAGGFSDKVILLNEPNECITHQDKTTIKVPTLAMMTQDTDTKKQLWQLITA
ncbi:MAG: hypothetical protein Q4B81_00575 [Moraxella sp.]|nr:hypothetical protein [Moraxella sp.]